MNTRRAARSSTTLEAARTVHTWAARAAVVDAERRTIDVLVAPFGETARVSDDGRTFYDEAFGPGGATVAPGASVFDGHRVTPHGIERGSWAGVATASNETSEGVRAVLDIARTAEGDRLLEAARLLGYVSVSAEYELPRTYAAGETVVRTGAADAVTIDGIAVLLPPQRGAFASAGGTARAARSETGDEGDEGDEEETGDEGDEANAALEAARAAIPELVRREVARYAGNAARTRTRRGPFDAYSSMRELVDAARAMPAVAAGELSQAFRAAYVAHSEARAMRALVDQVPADNPGVMQPTWLATVFGIIDRGRPAITALGGPASAGTTGLELNWPYFDGDLRALVGIQAAPKTEITSVKVSLKKGSADLETFAGGSDIAWQLARRSSPSYIATYNNIMTLAYALVTEDRFEDDLEAAATAFGAFDPTAADADGAALRGWVVGASLRVNAATGVPATVVLASTDSFEAIAARPWLWPAQYGTANAGGTADAGTLRVEVSNLPIIEAPALSAKTLVATNAEAARWHEDGPSLVTAEDVAKLGTDVAVWGLGATGIYLPAGVVKNGAGVPLARGK